LLTVETLWYCDTLLQLTASFDSETTCRIEAIPLRATERQFVKKLAIVGIVALSGSPLFAATDIDGVISDVSGYQTAATVIGIAVLLFVLGRKVIRKLF